MITVDRNIRDHRDETLLGGMKQIMNITATVGTWIDNMFADEHHRSHSWQHCYSFFQRAGQSGLAAQRDQAALHLGFYLASWGMYRGSGFLLNHSYTVHRNVVDILATSHVAPLWIADSPFTPDSQHGQNILAIAKAIKGAYEQFGNASDTLVTKILLGTTACMPACDRYFIAGFKHAGFPYTSVNSAFIDQLFTFCSQNEDELRTLQRNVDRKHRVDYPLMVLVDIYFNRLGYTSRQPTHANQIA